jgi:8-oxo-dGTP diphosphatase
MKQKEKEIRNEIVLGIIKNKDGKVIIINRLWKEKSVDESAMLTYAFPGGNIDSGETPEESVAREVRNETGLKVRVLRMISERIHPQFAASIKYYECEMDPSKTRPIFDVHEVESVKWVSPSEIRNYFTTDLDPKVAKFLGI